MTRQLETEDCAEDVYFLRGWKGDEDEEVDVESSKGSSRDKILPKTINSEVIKTTGNSSKALDSAKASGDDQTTDGGGEEECDSAFVKTRASHTLLRKRNFAAVDDVKVREDTGNDEVLAGETSSIRMSARHTRLQTRLNEKERMDARKFRNHFAAKLRKSKASNTEGKRQGTKSARTKKVNGSLEVSTEKSLIGAVLMPQKSSSSEQEQEALTLHVNLTVEQDKSSDSEEDGNSKLVTRKQSQVPEKALQAGEHSQVGRTRMSARKAALKYEAKTENLDNSTDSYEKNEVNTCGRSKRAKRDNKKNFTNSRRISLEKGASPKFEDNVSGTEISNSSKESEEIREKNRETSPAYPKDGGSIDVNDCKYSTSLEGSHDSTALRLGTEDPLQLCEQNKIPEIQDHISPYSGSLQANKAGSLTQTELAGHEDDLSLRDRETEDMLSNNLNEHLPRNLRNDLSTTKTASGKETGLDSLLGGTDNHDSICSKCKQEGKLICCDGKDCKITYHIGCLDPPLKDVPPNDWYCPDCAYKRIICGVLSVSKGIESIWDVKEDESCIAEGGNNAHQRKIIENIPESSSNTYFVKYRGVSHSQNIWLAEARVHREAPKLLSIFKKKLEQGKQPKWDPEWVNPERIIKKRTTMLSKKLGEELIGGTQIGESGSSVEWCVKWKNLGYEFCTWEVVDRTLIGSTKIKELIRDYEARTGIVRDCHKAVKSGHLFASALSNLQLQYPWIRGEHFQHDQTEIILRLCHFWQKGMHSIVVNEIQQERITATLGFLLCLLKEFQMANPFLVIVPSSVMEDWSHALAKLIPETNVIIYAGSKEAREIIQKYEFYNDDGVCMVQIALTTFDTLNLDVEHLKGLNFEVAIVDESQRLKGAKTSKSLLQLGSVFRLLLYSEPIKDAVDEYQHLLSVLCDVACTTKDSSHEEETLVELKARVSEHVVYESKQESMEPTYPKEFWVPVKMTLFQLRHYCKFLIEKLDTLARNKRGSEIVSTPNELLLKLREFCNHPFLVNTSYQDTLFNLTAKQLLDFGIQASGKLKLLDKILHTARSSQKRVLIITQINLRSGKGSQMDILDDYVRQQFGVNCYERLDGGLLGSKKSAAAQRFNAMESECFVFLLDRRACSHSIKLRSINCIIIFDSDWNPQNDVHALLRMYSVKDLEHVPICRFYCPHTIEERALIAARRDSELDSNHHNFTLALCQRLLRWGAQKNFEEFDKSKEQESPVELPYTTENINIFLGTDISQSRIEAGAHWETAIYPRQAHHYSKGLPLFGETEEEIMEEEAPPTEFWTELLRDRQAETTAGQVRGLRTRKKVQYREDPPIISQDMPDSSEDEEESQRKKRRLTALLEHSTMKGVRETSGGKDSENEQQVKSRLEGTDVAKTLGDNGERSQIIKKAAVESTAMSGGDSGFTEPGGGAGGKSEQQQLLLSMKPDLEKLCLALQFQSDTAVHVEQLLYSVGSFFKLPKEKSLLHAIELSLCWLAAERQHYSIDRHATLELAQSCFGVQLDKVDIVYARLEERLKKWFEQGGQQSLGSKPREADQDSSAEKTAQGPVLDQQQVAATELVTPVSFSGGQVPQARMTSSSQDLRENCVDTHRPSLESEVPQSQNKVGMQERQRSQRLQALINAQKAQIRKLDSIEQSNKDKLKQWYETACHKAKVLKKGLSADTQISGMFASGVTMLEAAFKATRVNLIQKQYEEREKVNKLLIEHSDDNANPLLETAIREVNEKEIFDSLPQVLKEVLENGEICSIDQTNLGSTVPGSHVNGNVLNARGGSNALLSSQPQPRPPSASPSPSPSPSPSISLSPSVRAPTLHPHHHHYPHPHPQPQPQPQVQAQTLRPQSQSPAQPQLRPPSQPHLFSRQTPVSHEIPQTLPTAARQQPPYGLPIPLDSSNEISRGLASNLVTMPASSSAVSNRNVQSTRVSQNVQPRPNQQFQTDPLAQEFIRLRKEQEKLRTIHEAEKDRIKAQFMKELEVLSKKYEAMLQEEDSKYTSKVSSLEVNLKKVEMNRRLAEVFRIKNSMDTVPATAAAIGASQAHNYQQPLPTHTRVPSATPSTVTTAVGSSDQGGFLRQHLNPVPSITRSSIVNTAVVAQGAMLGATTGISANPPQPQGQNAQVPQSSSHSVALSTTPSISFGQARSGTHSLHESGYRVMMAPSPQLMVPRVVGPVAGVGISSVPQPLAGAKNVAQSSLPTAHHFRASSLYPASNHSGGNSLPEDLSIQAPRCNSSTSPDPVAVGSLMVSTTTTTTTTNVVIPRENHGSLAISSVVPEILSNANGSERLSCDDMGVENMGRPPELNMGEVPITTESRCTVSTTNQSMAGHANQDMPIRTSVPSSSNSEPLVNPLCPEDSRSGALPADVICLSDDD